MRAQIGPRIAGVREGRLGQRSLDERIHHDGRLRRPPSIDRLLANSGRPRDGVDAYLSRSLLADEPEGRLQNPLLSVPVPDSSSTHVVTVPITRPSVLTHKPCTR